MTSTHTINGRKEKIYSRVKKQQESTPAIIYIFLLSMMVPVIMYAGPLRLSAYRIVLLISIVPCLFILLSGKTGKVQAPDILIILYLVWATFVLAIAHGIEDIIEFAGMHFVETLGPYLIARCYIRNSTSYVTATRIIIYTIIAMLPFTIFEALTARNLLLEITDKIATAIPLANMEPRLGLDRAQGVLAHPILYGVYCSIGFSLALYVLTFGKTRLKKLYYGVLVFIATGLSLSTGAWVGLVVQFVLIGWDKITAGVRRRWSILGASSVVVYMVVDLISNRTPIEVFISYLTFNIGNSWNRILIWRYGTASVLNHPIFGIGLNEWDRASWMSASMDNFWLLIAVRYGLPGFILFVAAMLIIMYRLGRLTDVSDDIKSYRAGLLIAIGGLIMAACTVHFWEVIYCLLMFLLGSGMWMLDQRKTETVDSSNKRNRLSSSKKFTSSKWKNHKSPSDYSGTRSIRTI